MPYGDLVSRVEFDLGRDSAFSYACHACNRCCRNKAIRVGPYEILRLARFLTEAGGTVLRSNPDRDCGFLGERGCSVHPDRPLACRIYPLARWVSPDGAQSFGHLTPHPRTEGVYGKSGTVQDYLDQQQLAPFFQISERDGRLYQRMVALLQQLDPKELDRRSERRAAVDEVSPGTLASQWIDIDATLAAAGIDGRGTRTTTGPHHYRMACETHAPLFWESEPPARFAHTPLPNSNSAILSPIACVIFNSLSDSQIPCA
jgi:Fe-S-cluster containining protein